MSATDPADETATESILLLGQFQELLELHIADRDRLRKELAEFR